MSGPPDLPIFFVYDRRSDWRDVAALDLPPHRDELRERLQWGPDVWIAQTYLALKRRGWNVVLTDEVAPGSLSLVHGRTYLHERRPHDVFLVVAQGDLAPALLADHVIVQNPRQAGRRATFVPHWPQSGLVPRDPSRGSRIERVGYFGYPSGLDPSFRTSGFQCGLAELGLELVLREEAWWDYSEIDVVLAVRRMHPRVLAAKPASKLVNAWRGGCLALLGPEPAFSDLRRSELDYLEVGTPDEALAALRRLRDEPGLFRAMVENGSRRAAELTPERIAERWESVLSEVVVPAYLRWSRGRGRRLARRARLHALAPAQALAEVRFAVKAAGPSARPSLYKLRDPKQRGLETRARARLARFLAVLWLLREEGPAPFVRALARRGGRRARRAQRGSPNH